MLESFGFRSKNTDFGAGRVVTSNIEFHGWHCATSARLLFKTESQLPLYGDNVLNNLIEVLSLVKVDGHEAVLRGNLESSTSFDVRVDIFLRVKEHKTRLPSSHVAVLTISLKGAR
jgi:hypothetical protein